jgi:tetratricopeptide (TPR) repeat protein
VFISSTFRDMHAERDELVKRVFPRLRKLCEQRGVTWGDVDLRWGIPDERKAEVLPICLAEIHRCRPYFIGLLGERYGWVPEQIAEELIEEQPWLKEHLEHSVTELEILHGVLKNPEMATHAFFYFRDPAHIDTLPAGQQPEFREGPTPEQIERFGKETAERRAEERRRKLAALKERVRASKFTVRENYRDPQELGRLVLDDLTGVIDALFPEEQKPDPLDREAAEHGAFAASRAGVYIGRQDYFDRLDAHAAGDGPPLVVLGESGGGKSALLANWARCRQEHPDELVLMHFIGASPYSADWAAMLRRIMGEFQRRFGIKLEIPDKPDALRLAFANSLHMAAAQGRVVLILDALNQLEDRDAAPDLVWLPPEIPANVRLILSTLPGRPMDDLEKRGWPALTVGLLAPDERREVIRRYLAQYTKALSPPRVERIAAAPQAANPLYLRALLEELRVFGAHEWLDQRVTHYLSALTIPELYEKILQRWEEDYERDRPGLVREAMTLLWAARRGLSEAELLELLGSSGQPLPRAHWSPLYLAAEQALVSRSGLIGFIHAYLREAVRRRYLPSEGEAARAHLRLASYFVAPHARALAMDPASEDLNPSEYYAALEFSLRTVEELPWQFAQARDWRRLYDLLANVEFLDSAWRHGHYDIKRYWAMVEANSPLRLVNAYRELEVESDFGGITLRGLADLLQATGHFEEALKLRKRSTAMWQGVTTTLGDGASGAIAGALATALCEEAEAREMAGDWSKATGLYREAERLLRRDSGDRTELALCVCARAGILFSQGRLDEALRLIEEAEGIQGQMGAPLALPLNLRGLISRAQGHPDQAMGLFQEAERIWRKSQNAEGVASALGNQGLILRGRKDLDGAMALHKREEQLCREVGFRDGLARCLGNQGVILVEQRRSEKALALFGEQERLCREMKYAQGLADCLGNQALCFLEQRRFDAAGPLLEEQEQICRRLGYQHGLTCCLNDRARVQAERGDLDGAMALLKEQERICRELGNPGGLATSLANQALLLVQMGRADDALALVEEAHQLATTHGLQALAEQIKPILDRARSAMGRQPPGCAKRAAARLDVDGSTPHPAADPERAFRLNLQYQQELARWRALPWWQRLRAKKPEPSRGI